MRMSGNIRLILLLSLLSWGCGIIGPDSPVEVRVRNESDLTFDEGVIYFHMDSITFPGLQPGESTPYKEVERAYDYATAQVVTGADTARLQVIDFVGETPLDGGEYTYVLAFFEGNPTSLIQIFQKDR
jgi:hypothetical protein